MHLAIRIALQILWTLIRKTFTFCQYLVWHCNGIQSRITENHTADAPKHSVQVLNILARHKLCILLQKSGADNFLLTHEEFVEPEYVLKDHITLYYINKDDAIFVEASEGVHASESQYGGFIRCAQYLMAKKFIVMPIRAFHKLGEKVGKPKGTIIFLCTTGRCGSTLVTQVFEETGSCIAYSEPDAINAISQLKGIVSKAERDRICKHCVNLMFKPVHFKQINVYALKLCPPTMTELPHILEHFPESKVMFIYRDGLKCSRSLSRASMELPLMNIALNLGRYSAQLTKRSFEAMGLPADAFEVQLESRLHFGAIVWAANTKLYLTFRDNGVNIAAIKYEDLLEDTTYAYQKMFEYCGLPYDATAVERAMGRDSQRDTPISLQNLAKYPDEKFTDKTRIAIDKVCDEFGLPRFPEPLVVAGTVSHRNKIP